MQTPDGGLDSLASPAAPEPGEPPRGADDPPTDKRLDLEGLAFDIRVAGPEDGELVILLHGFPQMSLEWQAQIVALAEAGYRVVAPNQRGYSDGARPLSPTDYDVEDMASDVLGFADYFDRDVFHLVGHDWGAVIAWQVAGTAPERLASLTSLSVVHPDEMALQLRDPTSCRYQSSAYVEAFSAPGAEALFLAGDGATLRELYDGLPNEDVYVDFFDSNPARLTGGLHWYRANFAVRQYTGPEVGPISTPTLFVYGGDETECDQQPENTADYVTGPYRFEVLPGVDHWIPERAPDRVNALLLEHFEAHPVR